jgi:pimeloyl-ACP methyl ester carboxylesterase
MNTVTSPDGTLIAYDRKGGGPTLIVIDGAMTTRMGPGKAELVDLMAPNFSVYTYDRRGRGDSGDTQPYAVQREIEDIEALINRAGTSALLYGHSSGGCLALEAARSLGAKIARVAVYEAPYNDDPAAQRAWTEYIRQLGEALADGRRGDAVALFMQYVGMPAEQIAGMRQAPFWAGMEAIGPTLAYDHTAIIGPTAAVPKDQLAMVSAPVLAICGGASYPFMCVTARTIAEAVPSGAHLTLPDQTHEVQPAAIAPALIEFFRSEG